MTDKNMQEYQQTGQPKCEYFTECGGCELQNLTCEEQLEMKKNTVLNTLKNGLGDLYKHLPEVSPVTPSPMQISYRNSIRLKICPKTGRLGFNRKKSNEIIAIKRCMIAEQSLNCALEILTQSQSWQLLAHHAAEITIASSPLDKKVAIAILPRPTFNLQKTIPLFGSLLEEHDLLKGALIYPGKKRGDIVSLENFFSIGDVKRYFEVPASISCTDRDEVLMANMGSFVQNNWDVNLKIMKTMKTKLDQKKNRSILDLHTGIGNFLLPLTGGKSHSAGCDVTPMAINDANENAKRWGRKIEFEVASAAQTARSWINEGKTASAILLDPPRGGAPEIMKLLHGLAPDVIIYLSCDISSLVRDIKKLIISNYCVSSIEPFDMFPQTLHVETLCVLRKR